MLEVKGRSLAEWRGGLSKNMGDEYSQDGFSPQAAFLLFFRGGIMFP